MNNFENIKIEQLSGSNRSKWLDKSQLKDYFDDKFFDDLIQDNVKIKKQWNMYIFEQKDINSSKISDNGELIKQFYVDQKTFQEYLKDQLKKEEISLESDLLLKEFFHEMDTQNRLKEAQKWVIDEQIKKLDTNVEQLTKIDDMRDNPELLISEVDYLLWWFETNKTRPKAPRTAENRYSKHRFEQVIRDDITSLKSIKRELSRYTYTTNMDYLAAYVETMKWHKKQLEKVRQMVVTWSNTAEIPAMLDSMKDVKKEALFQDRAAAYNVEYNKILKDATLTKLLNKDLEWFQEYLIWVWSGDIEHPEKDKFYEKHKKDFEEIKAINPQLYWEITTKKKRNDNPSKNMVSQEYRNSQMERNNRYCSKSWKWSFDKIWNMFSDLVYRWENPEKKEAWAKAGKIGAIIWWVVLWFKFIQSLFAKKWTPWKWWDVALYWGWLLALFNLPKIADWTKTVFGKDPDKIEEWLGVKNSKEYQKYVKPPIAAMEAIWWIPIKTLLDFWIIEHKYGKLKFNYNNYDKYINQTNISDSEKERLRKAADKIKLDESLLTDWLWLLWISTVKQMETLAWNDNNKTLLDSSKMAEHFENITESPVNAMLHKEWFKPKNPDAWYEITQDYYKNGSLNIVERMKKGLIIFNNEKNYTLQDMLQNSEINLQSKTIDRFKSGSWNLIRFWTYEEMFDTVQLTNFIKNNFKWKTANSTDPFHITLLWDIEFDNAKWYQVRKPETKVINSNFYKNTLKNISPTLWNNKELYEKYLNEWWNNEWKVS